MTSMAIHPPVTSPVENPRPPAAVRAVMSPWTWMAVTCLLLGISGGFRFWRDWKFMTLAAKNAAPPFHLAELPRAMGTWKSDPNSESQLDPEVARVAGATEHIAREYLDEKSGEKASALIVYGLAVTVFVHAPDVCYPAGGYQAVRGPIDRTITVPGVKGPVQCRWAIYMKRVGGISRYEESYYAFYHNGDWLTNVVGRWKSFRYQPGMLKVQIMHPVTSLSESGEGGPCESLFVEFVRQIDSRMHAGGPGPADAPAPTPDSPAPRANQPG